MKLKKIILFAVVFALLGIQGFLWYHYIYAPALTAYEFTNFSLVAALNALPFVSLQAPETLIKYCAFHPVWLGLLCLWPLLLIPTAFSRSDFPVYQRALSLIIRVFLFACIVLALVDIEKIQESDRLSVIYVADESASVPEPMLRAAENEIRQALKEKNDGVDVQVVAFADTPRIINTDQIREDVPFLQTEKNEDPDSLNASNIESALRFAYALFPENYAKRIVLLSDGNQTRGDALSEAARARAQNIRIDTKYLDDIVQNEILIHSDDVPQRDHIRVGQPFDITLRIDASAETNATLRVKKNDLPDNANTKPLSLTKGQNFITLTLTPDAPGELNVAFSLDDIDAQADRFPENNALLDTFSVLGKPKILYIEQNAASAAYLQRALAGFGKSSGQDFDVEVRTASGLPTSMADILRFSAVILGDVPKNNTAGRTNVTYEHMELLNTYVRKQGGGFIAIGGENAFGPGGYANTTIEKMLPVEFKNDNPQKKSSAAIALVIDKSGSMQHNHNLSIAKEAAKASVAALNPQDRVIVIGFDDAPYLVVPASRAVNRYAINDKISRMQPNGGTNILDALEMTYLELAMVSAKTKHVILLTDGRSPYAGIDNLVREMARAKITVSTIALSDADTTLLSRIANLGKGRAYIARDASSVPRLFVEETERVANQAIVEEPFVPRVNRAHDMIKGVELRTILGYVATKAKSGSQTILTAPNGDPILAHWNVGSGKTTAFTSDAKNRWASPWINASQSFSRFWAQVVRATMKQSDETRFDMNVQRENEHVRVFVDAVSENDDFLNHLSVSADIRKPSGEHFSLSLPQTAPGFYENTFPLLELGTYQARAELKNENDTIGYAQKIFAFPYALEFANPDINTQQLNAIAKTAAGLVNPTTDQILAPNDQKWRDFSPIRHVFLWLSLLALLLDVFLRRVRLARQ